MVLYVLTFIADPPAKAVTFTPEVVVFVGTIVRFECVIDGEGNPNSYTFTWTRTGDGSFRNVTDIGVLEFEASSVEQTDKYFCTPGNTAGQGKAATIQLLIHGEYQTSLSTQTY